MKTITLDNAYKTMGLSGSMTGTKRTHAVDLGNGDGFQVLHEISVELEHGGWIDVGYCHNSTDAALLAHAWNILPSMIDALKAIADDSDESTESGRAILSTALAALGEAQMVQVK